PAGSRVLHAALAKVDQGKRSLIGLAPAEGSVVTVAVLPLKGEERGRLPNAALLFARESVCEALMLCFFTHSHALTATKEHMLDILYQGFSAPEIAAQMDIAVSTIHSHVHSLCIKTRSSGVRQLVNRIAML